MRNLQIMLVSLALATLAVLGLLFWQGGDRATPTADARPAARDTPEDTSPAEAGGPGARALLEGGESAAGAVDADDGPEAPAAEPGPGQADPGTAARLAQVDERFRRRARAIAEALELTSGDERSLFEVLLGEYQRRAEYFDELRQNAFDPEARARVREELAAIQQWKTQELQARLGAELARAVQDFERESDRGLFQDFERDSKERTED